VKILGFGQPVGAIIQTAFVVPDIDEALQIWAKDLGAGPFFLVKGWKGERAIYRGNPCEAAVSLAMGFAGHMQIELIQPDDAHPSVYREHIDQHGFGFHHVAIASADVNADIDRLAKSGYAEVFRVGVPTGGDVVYMSGKDGQPGMIELIPVTEATDRVFTAMWQASVGWDGKDPVRPM